jgi:hypothetical protein
LLSLELAVFDRKTHLALPLLAQLVVLLNLARIVRTHVVHTRGYLRLVDRWLRRGLGRRPSESTTRLTLGVRGPARKGGEDSVSQ